MTPIPELNALQRPAAMQQVHPVRANGTAPQDGRWAPLWFQLVQHEWSSIALIPAERDASTTEIAWALAEFGRPFQKEPIYVLTTEHMSPPEVPGVVDALHQWSASGIRVLVALGSPLVQHMTVPLARAADASVLVVRLGTAETRTARSTIDAVGPACFVGSIVL